MIKVVLRFKHPDGPYAVNDIATFPLATAERLLKMVGPNNEPVCVEVRRINPPPVKLPEPPRTVAVAETKEVIPETPPVQTREVTPSQRPDKMVRGSATKGRPKGGGKRRPAAKRKAKKEEPKDDE